MIIMNLDQLKKTLVLLPINFDSCDLLTFDEFLSDVDSGMLMDDDGYGELATETGVSGITINPSDISEDDDLFFWRRQGFTHVAWYNK